MRVDAINLCRPECVDEGAFGCDAFCTAEVDDAMLMFGQR
jgi:hypothetical protein